MVVGRMVEFDSSLLPQSDNYTVELTLFVPHFSLSLDNEIRNFYSNRMLFMLVL